jgi:hypothetical protein
LFYPWPPLLLVLLTLLALLAAYAVRPVVQVDLGAYYDSAFLQGFHAREVDASGAAARWQWPQESTRISLPGQRSGDWIATISAFDELPGRPLSGVALNVNGYPVSIPSDSSHQFIAFIPADIADDPELTLELRPALSGGPEPASGIVEQVTLEPARTYRWSQDESQLVLPGLGRGNWQLDLELVAAHPNSQPVQAEVLVNGVPLASLPDSDELRRVSLLVPASVMNSGTMAVTLRANTFEDPRPLGLLLAGFAVSPVQQSAPVLGLLPPWGTLAFSLVVVLGLYASLALLSAPARAGPTPPRRLWLAALLPLALIALGGWALATHRFPTSFMLPGLAALALWSVLLLLALRPLLRRAFGEAAAAPLAWGWSFVNLLLLIFFAGYWLKVAGMLYPYFIAIDVHWHMDRVRWILNGQLGLLYGTDSPLNESTMPEAEWGPDRPVIPYSPYFHMFATAYALLPWSLEFTNNMVSALVDSSRVLIVALVAVKAGLTRRAALLAALLLAVLPVNFLLLSWGNTPTTFGLWWTLAVTACMVIAWEELHRPRPFVSLLLLLLGALLIYTVAGVFTGLFLFCFTGALLLASWRAERMRALLPGLRPLWLATGLALGLVLLIYYGQYILPIIERTLPYFASALTESREATGRVGDTWGAYLLRHGRLTAYGIVVPLLLTAVYLGWEWRARFRQPAATPDAPPQHGRVVLWAAVAGWVAVMLLFLPLAFKISLVDKHFFAAIPLLVLASAAVLDRLWRYGWPVWALTAVYYCYLAASAVTLWLTRIVEVRQE